MNIIVTSKRAFDELMLKHDITDENVENKNDTFFISINSTLPVPASGEEDEPPHFQKSHENVLVQRFDDVDKDYYKDLDGKKLSAKAFTEDQAREMAAFILKNAHRKSCIVHCAAGISRSGAVGTFINDFVKGDWFVFKKTNPHIHPNVHVLSQLRKAMEEMT